MAIFLWRYLLFLTITSSLGRVHPFYVTPPAQRLLPRNGVTWNCTRYSNTHGPSITCHDDASQVCTGGCVGAVVASECNKGDQPSGAQQICTISYSQHNADLGICVNDEGSFRCAGVPLGKATCSGCSTVTKPVPENASNASSRKTLSNQSNPNSAAISNIFSASPAGPHYKGNRKILLLIPSFLLLGIKLLTA